jgi:hypothetical protein
MQKQAIKVIIKEPYKEAVVSEIVDDLTTLRKIIGGYLEVVPFPTVKGVDIILDEEGKIKKLAGNFFIPHFKDCVVGTAIICSHTNDGEFASLSEKQIKQVNNYLKHFEIKKDFDLYKDFELLNAVMNKRMKEFNSDMQ